MKATLFMFLVLATFACGGIEVVQPSKPATIGVTDTATGTATGTSSATGTQTATAAATAPAATPQVVVNNTIDNTQNNAPATAPAAPATTAHQGLIAKGDSEAEVQAVLGTPSSIMECNSDQTGWWYGMYCVGFEGGTVASQYEVPADKLYLPSW